MLASASNAIIIGFNVKPEPKALQQAQIERVDIKSYNVIYEAINDVKAALAGMLAPDHSRGAAREGAGPACSSRSRRSARSPARFMSEGKTTRNAKLRVVRNGRVARRGAGHLAEAVQGRRPRGASRGRSAASASATSTVQVGDVLELFTTEEVARTL